MKRGTTSIPRILGLSLVLVMLVPFLPLAYFTGSGYEKDVARIEEEIEATNRQIAHLAASYLDGFLAQVRKEAMLLANSGLENTLPGGPPAIRWERVGPGGIVLDSQISEDRIGKGCGYERLLLAGVGDKGSYLSGVDRWIEGLPPTVLHAVALDDRPTFLAGVLDTVALHDVMTAWSDAALDRHVYAVDATGNLVFYSDIGISARGEDLRDNPPIRLHRQGREGPIRFRSVVSGKERLGFVQRIPSIGWAVIVSADIGSRLIELETRTFALAGSILFALIAALAILHWTSRRLVHPLS